MAGFFSLSLSRDAALYVRAFSQTTQHARFMYRTGGERIIYLICIRALVPPCERGLPCETCSFVPCRRAATRLRRSSERVRACEKASQLAWRAGGRAGGRASGRNGNAVAVAAVETKANGLCFAEKSASPSAAAASQPLLLLASTSPSPPSPTTSRVRRARVRTHARFARRLLLETLILQSV